MNKLILILTALLVFTGCANTTPIASSSKFTYDKLEHANYKVTLVPLKNEFVVEKRYSEAIAKVKNKSRLVGALYENNALKGFSFWAPNSNKCVVYYVHGDTKTLMHEINHCYYGNWHKKTLSRSH